MSKHRASASVRSPATLKLAGVVQGLKDRDSGGPPLPKTLESDGRVAGAGKVFDGLARRASLHQPPDFLPECLYRVSVAGSRILDMTASSSQGPLFSPSQTASAFLQATGELPRGQRRRACGDTSTTPYTLAAPASSMAAACRHTLRRRATEIAEAGLCDLRVPSAHLQHL